MREVEPPRSSPWWMTVRRYRFGRCVSRRSGRARHREVDPSNGERRRPADRLARGPGRSRSVFAEDSPLQSDSPVDDIVTASIDQGDLDWRLWILFRRVARLRAVADKRRSIRVANPQLDVLDRRLRHDIGTDVSVVRSRAKQRRGELGSGGERAMADGSIEACNRGIDLTATVRSVSRTLRDDGQRVPAVPLNRVVRERVERVQNRYPGAQVAVGAPDSRYRTGEWPPHIGDPGFAGQRRTTRR